MFDVVGLWTWNVRNDVLQADAGVCDYFSVPLEDGKAGVPLAAFLRGVHAADRPMVIRRISRAVASGEPFLETYRVVTHSRGIRWVQANGICFRDAEGRAESYPGSLVDVTDGGTSQPHALVVERLMEARQFAERAQEPVLKRLIEAVLLEAGLRLAGSMKDGTAPRRPTERG